MSEEPPRRGPTLKIIARVFAKDCTLSVYNRLLAVALAEHVGRDTGEAWPSLVRLQECTGMSRSAVVRGLNEITTGERPLFYKSWARSLAGKRDSLTYVLVDSPEALESARAECSKRATNLARKRKGAPTEHARTELLPQSSTNAPAEHLALPHGALSVLAGSNNSGSESGIEPEREPPRARGRADAAPSPSNGNGDQHQTRNGEGDDQSKAAILALVPGVDRPRGTKPGVDREALLYGAAGLRAIANRSGA